MTEQPSNDAFLGGKVHALQPAHGFRAGLDTVMLAAAVPAKPGERIVDAGCGPGVASLCLAARVEGAKVTGIEIEPEAAALARENAARNNMRETVSIIEADVGDRAQHLEKLGLVADSADHAMANPPYLADGTATPPPSPMRARAFSGNLDLIEAWVKFCVRMVRPGGTVTLVHRADRLGDLLAALARRTGDTRVLPLWPGGGKPAGRVIVQAVKGSNAPLTLLPGIALHGENGVFTPEAEAVLRNGAGLSLKS